MHYLHPGKSDCTHVHYLGLFIGGALLLCRTFNNIENKIRCGGKPIVLALCTALLIEIAGVANMRGILQLFRLDS
jgi:hypothetical protein